jgi:hypothetical protein
MHELTRRGIGLKVLAGEGAAINTTTAAGKLALFAKTASLVWICLELNK